MTQSTRQRQNAIAAPIVEVPRGPRMEDILAAQAAVQNRREQLRARGNAATVGGGNKVRQLSTTIAEVVPIKETVRRGRVAVRETVDIGVGYAGEQTEQTRARGASTTLMARAAVRGAIAAPVEVAAMNTRRRANSAAGKVVKHHEKVAARTKDAETHRFAAEQARADRKHTAAAFHEFMSGVSKKRAAKSSIRLSNATLNFDARRDTLVRRNASTEAVLSRADALEERAQNRRAAAGLAPVPSLREARVTGEDTSLAVRERASAIADRLLNATPRVTSTPPEIVPMTPVNGHPSPNGNGRHASA